MKMKKVMVLLIGGVSLLTLVACGNKLTNDNFSKVKNGMTEAEVRAILGKPDEVETSEILGLKNTSYLYEKGDTRASINFISNNVISKHGSFK